MVISLGITVNPVDMDFTGLVRLDITDKLGSVKDFEFPDGRTGGQGEYVRLLEGKGWAEESVPPSYLKYLKTKVLILDTEQRKATFFRVSGDNNPINVFGLRVVPDNLDLVIYHNAMDLEQGYIRVGNLMEYFNSYGVMLDKNDVLDIFLEMKIGKKTFLKVVNDLKKTTVRRDAVSSSVLLTSLSDTFSEIDSVETELDKMTLWGDINDNFVSIFCKFVEVCEIVYSAIGSLTYGMGSCFSSFREDLIEENLSEEQKNDEQFMLRVMQSKEQVRKMILQSPITAYESTDSAGSLYAPSFLYLQKITAYAEYIVNDNGDISKLPENDIYTVKSGISYGYSRYLKRDSDIEVLIKKHSYNYIDMLMRTSSSELFLGFDYEFGSPVGSYSKIDPLLDQGQIKKAFNYLMNDLYKQFEKRGISVNEVNYTSIIDLLLSNKSFYEDYFNLMYRQGDSYGSDFDHFGFRNDAELLVVNKVKDSISGLMADNKVDKILDVFRDSSKLVYGGFSGSRGFLDSGIVMTGRVPTVVTVDHSMYNVYNSYFSGEKEVTDEYRNVISFVSSFRSRSRVVSKVLSFIESKFLV